MARRKQTMPKSKTTVTKKKPKKTSSKKATALVSGTKKKATPKSALAQAVKAKSGATLKSATASKSKKSTKLAKSPPSKEPVVLLANDLTALKVGDLAPDFTATTDTGSSVRLADYRGKKFVILYFYPKDDTPGCTIEACDFGERHPHFQKKGAVVFGVSKDSVVSHQKFKKKYGFEFPLLADESGQICEAYGVWKLKQNYGKSYLGIERTTFVIGKDGRIAKIFNKVRVDGHAEAVLHELN